MDQDVTAVAQGNGSLAGCAPAASRALGGSLSVFAPPGGSGTPPLAADGLRHAYGFRHVLVGVELCVGAGEVLAVFGPNGAGKSTLLAALAGLLRPDGGSVYWWGADALASPGYVRRRIGLIGHQSFLFDELTAEENLTYYAQLLGLGAPAERAREAIAAEGLGLHARRPVRELSRGMTQRLALCRAWLAGPRIVLADEPTTGLDPEAAARLHGRLAALRAAGGAAVVVAHDLAASLHLADRYLILAGGAVTDTGSTLPWRGQADAFAVHYARAVATGRRLARQRAALRAPAVLPRQPAPSAAGGIPSDGWPADAASPATSASPAVLRAQVAGPGPGAAVCVPGGAVVRAVLFREVRLWWRGRERLGAATAFGLLVALVFGLALDPTTVDLRPVFAGVLWTGLLFAGLPAFSRAMAGEWDNDALYGFRGTGAGTAALFYGKCLGNLAGFALAELVLVPAFVAILQIRLTGSPAPVIAALALGTLGFAAAGSLLAAVVARALGPAAGGTLPLVSLPLLSPVILGTVRVVQGVLDAAPAAQSAWLLMLLVYAGLFWFLPLVLFPIVADA